MRYLGYGGIRGTFGLDVKRGTVSGDDGGIMGGCNEREGWDSAGLIRGEWDLGFNVGKFRCRRESVVRNRLG